MFVDASALCAVLLEEEDAERFSRHLEAATVTSALAVYETALAIIRVRAAHVAESEEQVRELLRRADVAILPVESETVSLALQAHAKFGKGRHPAKLNLCDCFAYAMAKQLGVPLLYKGDDFALTDLA